MFWFFNMWFGKCCNFEIFLKDMIGNWVVRQLNKHRSYEQNHWKKYQLIKKQLNKKSIEQVYNWTNIKFSFLKSEFPLHMSLCKNPICRILLLDNLVPLPHVFVQESHLSHCPHWQSTKIARKMAKFKIKIKQFWS